MHSLALENGAKHLGGRELQLGAARPLRGARSLVDDASVVDGLAQTKGGREASLCAHQIGRTCAVGQRAHLTDAENSWVGHMSADWSAGRRHNSGGCRHALWEVLASILGSACRVKRVRAVAAKCLVADDGRVSKLAGATGITHTPRVVRAREACANGT